MFKQLPLLLSLLAILASPTFVLAGEGHSGDCASCHTLNVKDASELLKKVGASVNSVRQAPVKGYFELLIEKDGNQGIIYLDYSRKNLMQGVIFNLETLQPVSAHEQPRPKQVTKLAPQTIPVDKSIVLGNPKGSKKLYVFTDPDCPYCRKAHEELKKLTKIAPDVAIHVMLFPLAMHPAAYDKARIILETRSLAILDKAFEGKEVPKPATEQSKKSVDEIIKFANSSGISGTPTLVMPDGKIEVGVRDAETLKKMLDGN